MTNQIEPASEHRPRGPLSRIAGVFEASLRWITGVSLGLLAAMAIILASHMALRFCPLKFSRFPVDGDRPVVYGLIMGGHNLDRARRREIVLGGCLVDPICAVCRYCPWPTRFWDPLWAPVAVPLDGPLLASLGERDAAAVRAHAIEITARVETDIEDRVTAALVTPTDVWIGTWFVGLHRYDRTTREWRSFEPVCGALAPLRFPGHCVKRIWGSGAAVCVEHADMDAPGYFRIHHTTDRGGTWVHGHPSG